RTDGGGSRGASRWPTPEHLERPFTEDGEPPRIAPGGEDLGVQRRRTDDLDAREVSQEATDRAGLLHDDEDAPRLPIPPTAHLPASGSDVPSVFRPFDIVHKAEVIENLQPLARRARFGGERLDAVLDHNGERDVVREPVSARCDHLRILQGRERRVAGETPFVFVDFLRPYGVRTGRMSPATAGGSRFSSFPFVAFAAFAGFEALRRRFGAGSASADPAASFFSSGSAIDVTPPASIHGR